MTCTHPDDHLDASRFGCARCEGPLENCPCWQAGDYRMIRKTYDLSATAAAIDEYDRLADVFEAVKHQPGRDFGGPELRAMHDQGIVVGETFGRDTVGLNSIDTCRDCVRPGNKVPPVGSTESFVRRMVRQWREDGSPTMPEKQEG